MGLKINERVFPEVTQKLLATLTDPNSNLDDFREKLIRLANQGESVDVYLGMPIAHSGFSVSWYNKVSGKHFMVGGLVYDPRDNSWSIHT